MKLTKSDIQRITDGFQKGFDQFDKKMKEEAESPHFADEIYEILVNPPPPEGLDFWVNPADRLGVVYKEVYLYLPLNPPKFVPKSMSGYSRVKLDAIDHKMNPRFREIVQQLSTCGEDKSKCDSMLRLYLTGLNTTKRLIQEIPEALKYIHLDKRTKIDQEKPPKRKIPCEPMPDELKVLLVKARMYL